SVGDPLTYARERHAHEPASAFARAPLERRRGAERHQVAAHVVDRRYGKVLRLPIARRERGHAAHRLHDAVEAAPRAPGPGRVPGRKRYAYDSGTQRGEGLRREAARRQRLGPVRPGEDVALRCEAFERRAVFLGPEVEACRELADAGIDVHRARIREMGRADLQHVGAVLGETARARGPREHARKIEHAYSFE